MRTKTPKISRKPQRVRCSVCHLLFDKSSLNDQKQCFTCRKVKEDTSLLADKIRESNKLPVTQLHPHLIIEARAGTGKTTTLIEGLKRIKGLSSNITPSPQQAAVWEQMELSKDVKTVCFVAFNKSIAEELKRRVPNGCEANTMHSMGFKAVGRAFSSLRVNNFRVQDIISDLLSRDIRDLRRMKPTVIKGTEKLVGLCKMNLVGLDALHKKGLAANDITGYDLSNLASYYDIDLNGEAREVFDLVPRVLERCKQIDRDHCLDFNDMIWLPVVLDLPIFQYDLLLVDEAQDLNRCQQELAKRAGKRLIFCGDPKQAIYGFAGADAESMARLEKELSIVCPVCEGKECSVRRVADCPACHGSPGRGCVHLPLTVTRRCGKAIVREAQKIVPDFEAWETNPEGLVNTAHLNQTFETGDYHTIEEASDDGYDQMKSYRDREDSVTDGDMVLCRCNAPLVSECFRFLRAGKKANINGRDIGRGLVNTIKKMSCCKGIEDLDSVSVTPLASCLDEWLYRETTKELAKRNPSNNRIINLQDKHDCLACFCKTESTVGGVVHRIEEIFKDGNQGGILLSSVHKAKGLEAKRVFILQPKGSNMPHPMAKSSWEKEQEMNIKYVAITRAIEELVWVY